MNLIAVTITASSDAEPQVYKTYDWRKGDNLDHLQIAIDKLSEYLAQQRSDLAVALSNQKPIETK